MARPGIMLYFDILEPIKVLPDADKGRLLVAMLEYGQSGIVPVFDGMLALAWGFVKPKIDKDEAEYNQSVLRRQYATTCRERKKKGEPDISFEEWLKTIDNQNNHMIPHDNQKPSMMINDNQWYPTTTTTPSTSTSTTTSSTTATAAAATTSTTGIGGGSGDQNSNVTVMGGSLGKGVVFLSQEQTDDLLDRLDLDTFNYYVDKLSQFIIKNGAHVKNHYETILKWWTEDGVVRKQVGYNNVPKGASGKLGQAELDAIGRVLSDGE